MWCSYCQKSDHDDKDCWSTRQVRNDATPIQPSPNLSSPPFRKRPVPDCFWHCRYCGMYAARCACCRTC